MVVGRSAWVEGPISFVYSPHKHGVGRSMMGKLGFFCSTSS